jgi:hypothetical protein
VVDWDDITERAANLTANNPAIGGEFDVKLALEQMKVLEGEFESFNAVGLKSLEKLLAAEYEEAVRAAGSDDDDAVVEPPGDTDLEARGSLGHGRAPVAVRRLDQGRGRDARHGGG